MPASLQEQYEMLIYHCTQWRKHFTAKQLRDSLTRKFDHNGVFSVIVRDKAYKDEEYGSVLHYKNGWFRQEMHDGKIYTIFRHRRNKSVNVVKNKEQFEQLVHDCASNSRGDCQSRACYVSHWLRYQHGLIVNVIVTKNCDYECANYAVYDCHSECKVCGVGYDFYVWAI